MMTPPVRSLLLGALMVAALAGMYAEGVGRGLDTAVPERFRYYGIPIALSADRYGLPGYVAYEEIAARFFNDKPIDLILAQDLPAALGENVITGAQNGVGLFFVPADDKGNVTFTRLAFRLFGAEARSLYRTFFVLLLLSIGAFIAAFWSQPARLWVGVCALLASAALVSAYRSELLLPHVATVYDPRSYGVIAILAVLHIGFSCIDGRWSRGRLAGVIYQAFMIVFAVHMRFENVMLVASLVAWLAGYALWNRRVWARAAILRHAWALLVLVLIFVGSLGLERVAYHPRYFTTHMAHHLVWHNVGIGLALHPEFAKTFKFPQVAVRRVDEGGDGAMMMTVAAALLNEGKRDTIEKIFGATYSNPTGDAAGIAVNVGAFFHSAESDLALYDSEVKRFVLGLTRAHPWRTIELYVRYKPRYILAHYLWFMGLTSSSPAIDAGGFQSPLFGGGEGRRSPLATPVPWIALILLGVGLAAAPIAAPLQWASALVASTALLIFGLAPMMVTYAAPFLMATPLAALYLMLFLGTAMLVSATRRSDEPSQLLSEIGWWQPLRGDLVPALTLSLATLACVVYFAPLGVNSGFVDMGHDGYQLRQALDLAAGKMLFRDTFDQYGPLGPYLNLAGFLALGERLLAIKYFIAIWYGLTTLVMFALARQFLSTPLSAFTIALWLAVAPFYQHGVMVSPHAYSLLFQAAAMLLLLRRIGPGTRTGHCWLVGLLCGAVWLLKQTLGLLFVSSILLFLALQWFGDREYRRRHAIGALKVAAGFVVVAVAALAWLAGRGALHDWYLQTVEFPNVFYLRRASAGKSGVALALDLATQFLTLHWRAESFWLVLRIATIAGTVAALVRKGTRDWKLVLAGCVTLLLWLAAFPSANYMHQWWTLSVTICAAVYALQGAVAIFLDRIKAGTPSAAGVTTMAIVALMASPLVAVRWSDSRARNLALSETIAEPRSVSGIRVDPVTHKSLGDLYRAMAEYRTTHPEAGVVSIDSADGDTQGVAETLPLLSFFGDNEHPFPIYWHLPVLSDLIYPEYEARLASFLRVTAPLVVDYRLAGWPDRKTPPGYHELLTAPTREGRLILYASDLQPTEETTMEIGFAPELRDITELSTGALRRGFVYVWPAEGRLPETLDFEAAGPDAVALMSPIVAGNRGEWLVNGVADAPYSYLLQYKPRRLRQGTQFVATGLLEQGGLTLGLLKAGAWVGYVNVSTPGWFAAGLQVPEDGEYEMVVANLVKPPVESLWIKALRRLGMGFLFPSDLRNRFHIQQSGWVAPHEGTERQP